GFTAMDETNLKELYDSLGLAMTFKDFLHIQNYFKNDEKRDPSMTEIRVLDTYWSEHCRHTTFSTEVKDVQFDDGFYKAPIEDTYKDYLETHKNLYKGRDDKFVCLMDLALMAMKRLKKEGKLADQEESDEINACSIVVPVEVDGKTEEWLVNFKNETHNHPTEIEPFGGAATCLGGAIRDPLSGRTYVYQAMRVTGAADPTVSVKDTMNGKLPQKKIVRSAAHGYSSYGNQIGLATGYVKEIYHPNYVAKRMEIGAVMGAAPRRAVQRLNSDPGDIIILLGGETGRDGCGGATGSSKAHTTKSIDTCGAEVQKGNAPTERKLQRLFRREEVSHIIKKCNDFGAGGVSVAIGELADGLRVQLDKVPKKYAGLDGTEIAISESQERMAVVVAKEDVDTFLKYALNEENVVLLRTFSKLFSIAACRLGVVISNPQIIHYVKNAKLTFDANAIALLFAERILDHPEMIEQLIETEKEGKAYTLAELTKHGYETRDCRGNFIFVTPKHQAIEVAQKLETEKKILVKSYGNEMLKKYLRISVGSKDAMERFLTAFFEIDERA
ncbi:MAG: aminotransferase class I/II-fold pyridoxal phosphate-dependent enzyme, partial [Clostridiales bacterium]|nr:aminotransferase class I/II-fold pyridoxal phosphate-dependent enzyme [Clostridiales bacterium]